MDTFGFVLLNFTEMNKLWVRLQHQVLWCFNWAFWSAGTRSDKGEKGKRKERSSRSCNIKNMTLLPDEKLCDFLFSNYYVGKNLHALGQIEGVDLEMYNDTVLPMVLEPGFSR